MGFELQFVKSWDGWVVRSPDNIQFILQTESGMNIESNTGILNLIEFYKLAKDNQMGDLFFGPQMYFEISRDNGEIVMRVNNNIDIHTTYDEMKNEAKNLLRASFESMDAQECSSSREDQLQTYDSVKSVYNEMFD